MTERRRGTFITFEGPDGSGKTTQMRLLAERLAAAGYEVIVTQEPGGTAIGNQIRSILLNPSNQELCPVAEMLLYFAARAQNFDEVIQPAWERGAVVLSDRFTDSTLAYQGGGRGLGTNVVLQLHDIACHGHQPDLTVCLDIEPEAGLERVRSRNNGKGDRMDEQKIDFHNRVRAAYQELAGQHPERIRVVDGAGSMADVAARVWDVVKLVVRP